MAHKRSERRGLPGWPPLDQLLAFAPIETATPYDRLGGADGVRQLVDRFYDLMDTLEETRPVRDMHPADLESSREKLWMFLSGFLGGPSLYIERYGHPRLRQRHLPFAVDAAARDQWMLCMERALTELVPDALLRGQLLVTFERIADHMRNQPEGAP